MRVMEEAFTYRLVWALEAIRTRRATLGWSPDIIAGGGAAALETGVPQFMMSMLIRAGLPSRRAAMAAVLSSDGLFTSPAEMREWLGSNEIAAFTAPFKKVMRDLKPSLISGTLPGRSSVVTAMRIGRGKATWPRPNDP